jgi:phosphoribosylformylglycinamidine cyclo-ligase
VRFGPWQPLDRAAELAPSHPGLLQVRAEGLLRFPRGQATMVFYAASADDQPLADRVRARQATDELARAAALGGRWIRFADSPRPAVDLARLLADFQARFGALPPANEPEPHMSTTDDKRGISYRDAGVDIDAGDELVERIKKHVARTRRPEVLGGLGGFAGLCALPKGYREPLLVSCTDGVGTKLKLAFLTGRHDTVGIDLVAMNVNDMVVSGAEPLLFLDYFASGKLEVGVAEQVISGIATGCVQAGCSLVGGETAELPGFYQPGEYDLAGFSVGVVERDGVVDGRTIGAGDVLLGLGSSGFHSNGYSLVRKVLLEHAGLDLAARPPGGEGIDEPLADALLRPTRIYVRSLRKLYAAGLLKGAAHITGGGLVDNPTRMLPGDSHLKLQIDVGSWTWPGLFRLVARLGDIPAAEMRRTFNVGIGMVVCVAADRQDEARRLLESEGETVHRIGRVAAGSGPEQPVEFVG